MNYYIYMDKMLLLEAKRKKLVNTIFILLTVSLLIGIVAGVAAHFVVGLISFVIIFVLSYLIFVLRGQLKFKESFKSEVVMPTLSELYDNLEYLHKQGFDKETVYNTGLVANGNTYRSNDYIRAKFKGINFESADVEVQNVTSNGKTTTTTTYFKGKWMIFDFAAAYRKYLYIREKQFFNSTTFGLSIFSKIKVDKVKFESVEFNKEFEVRSSDEQFAFYIITPKFMECLKKLKENTDGQLSIGFLDGKLHIAIDSRKDDFEHSLFTPITMAVHDKIKNEASVITNFMEQLLVNNYKREGI